MSSLREFLCHGGGGGAGGHTLGGQLYQFWLDCERYRDSVNDRSDPHSRRLRTRLFR